MFSYAESRSQTSCGVAWKVPLQLARRRPERDDAVRVQVVTRTVPAVEVGGGVAGAPVDQIELGVVRAGHPGGAAAVPPAVPRPRLVARLPGAGNDVEPPALLAGPRVERHDMAAVRQVAAARADHDHVVHQQRRRAHVAAELGAVLHQRPPRLLAGLDVDRHHVVVVGAEVQVALAERQPADRLDRPPAVARVRRRMVVDVTPDLPPVGRVEGVDAVPGGGEIHHAVRHERRALQAVFEHAALERPRCLQVLDVAGVDLVEGAMAQRAVRAAVHQPVLRLVVGVAQALPRHLAGGAQRGGRQHEDNPAQRQPAHRSQVNDRHVLSLTVQTARATLRGRRRPLNRAGRRRTASARQRWRRTAGGHFSELTSENAHFSQKLRRCLPVSVVLLCTGERQRFLDARDGYETVAALLF